MLQQVQSTGHQRKPFADVVVSNRSHCPGNGQVVCPGDWRHLISSPGASLASKDGSNHPAPAAWPRTRAERPQQEAIKKRVNALIRLAVPRGSVLSLHPGDAPDLEQVH